MIQGGQATRKKYEGQVNAVKKNREDGASTKGIEIQGLDIQVSEKKIREFEFEIKNKTEIYDGTQETLETARKDLEIKKGELDTITGETQKEEDELTKQADAAEKDIEERLVRVYRRL